MTYAYALTLALLWTTVFSVAGWTILGFLLTHHKARLFLAPAVGDNRTLTLNGTHTFPITPQWQSYTATVDFPAGVVLTFTSTGQAQTLSPLDPTRACFGIKNATVTPAQE